jgi:hypothetical protein
MKESIKGVVDILPVAASLSFGSLPQMEGRV